MKTIEQRIDIITDRALRDRVHPSTKKLAIYLGGLKLILRSPYEVVAYLGLNGARKMFQAYGWKRVRTTSDAEHWQKDDEIAKWPLNPVGPIAATPLLVWAQVAHYYIRVWQFLLLGQLVGYGAKPIEDEMDALVCAVLGNPKCRASSREMALYVGTLMEILREPQRTLRSISKDDTQKMLLRHGFKCIETDPIADRWQLGDIVVAMPDANAGALDVYVRGAWDRVGVALTTPAQMLMLETIVGYPKKKK